jgi:uncharacterized membrane protein YbaN (DUF454 family)
MHGPDLRHESSGNRGREADGSRARRWVFNTLGCLLVGLGAVGVLLPLLPTTPLMLLAAACFARGSGRLHAWLHGTRLFGPTLRAWEETRSMPAGAKVTAITLVVVVLGSTILFAVSHPALRVALAVLGLGIIAYLARIPTRPGPRLAPETVRD